MRRQEDSLRDKIEKARKDNPGKAREKAGELRAEAVVSQYRQASRESGRVHHGGVEFWSVEPIGDGGVAIRTGPDEVEDDYRIFNPPTLVRDGAGEIVVNGKRYREDPLGAVAEVIQQHRQNKIQRRSNR